MQIYYVEIENQFEMTFLTYTYHVYFNSKKAMDDFKEYFIAHKSSLERIVKSGKAYFNSRGILNP